MNNNKYLSLVLFLSALFTNFPTFAQNIGVADIQRISQSLSVEQQLDKEFNQEQKQLSKLQTALQAQLHKLRSDAINLSNEEIEKLKKSIMTQREQYDKKYSALQHKMQRHISESNEKMLSTIMRGIEQVAESEGYDLILPKASVSYVNDKHDISDRVIDVLSRNVD